MRPPWFVLTYSRYARFFERAYAIYPDIPRGVLEAISYSQTGFDHRTPKQGDAYASYGLMGLVLGTYPVLKENLLVVSGLSGYQVDEIRDDPEKHVMAFAAAYAELKSRFRKVDFRIDETEVLTNRPFPDAVFQKPRN